MSQVGSLAVHPPVAASDSRTSPGSVDPMVSSDIDTIAHGFDHQKGIGWSEGPCGLAPVPDGSLLSRCEPESRVAADWSTMSTASASQAGSQLDDHHEPETNGRMAVCRRCGSQTDSPAGRHHMPAERQVIRSGEWLVAQSKIRQIDHMREARGG